MQEFQLLGSGIYLPERRVSSRELDRQLGLAEGSIESKTGVYFRHYAGSHESASHMAVAAIKQAVDNAGISPSDIDCLIAASGTMEQAIPCNAAKILAQLNLPQAIAGFDVNATCLSALLALKLAISLLNTQQYQCIVIASSDIASPGLNWQHIESAGLFGDGAAALVVTKSGSPPHSSVISSLFKTFPGGVSLCEIRGGGSLNHPTNIQQNYRPYSLFEMQGKALFRATSRVIQPFLNQLFATANLNLNDIDWIIPHQASGLAMQHLIKTLHINPNKIVNLLAQRGNQIAVSLPSALHELRRSNKAKPGDKALMIGTSAGLSLGALILEIY